MPCPVFGSGVAYRHGQEEAPPRLTVLIQARFAVRRAGHPTGRTASCRPHRIRGQTAQPPGRRSAADVSGRTRRPGPSGPLRNLPARLGEDHHAKSTTEGHWTWHLAPVPWERHSSGSRCWSGLLVRWLRPTELHGR